MLSDIITTAVAKDGSRTRIEQAGKGERYVGIAHHEQCLLYPVHRQGRKSSFAHLPNRQDCRPSGESVEHKKLKEAWYRYLRWLPFFGDVTWNCHECLKPHVYDLLDGATSVVMEERLANGLKPDITIRGLAGQPLVFLEFRKSHLSSRIREFAQAQKIPLFVGKVDNGEGAQATLHNRQRQSYDGILEFDDDMREMARLFESLPGTEFAPFYDSNGDLVDAFLHYDNANPSVHGVLRLIGMPKPHRGHYLFAHDSTLECDSQRLDHMPWLLRPSRAKAS